MPIDRRTRATFVIYRSRTLKPLTPRCPITSATGCCPRAASGPAADDYSRDLRPETRAGRWRRNSTYECPLWVKADIWLSPSNVTLQAASVGQDRVIVLSHKF